MRFLILHWMALHCSQAGSGAAPPPVTAPWSSFRGDPCQVGFRTGPISDAPRLLWSFDSKSEVLSTAAIAGGRVYLGTSEAGFLCLDLSAGEKSGKEIWRSKNEAKIQSSPAVRGGKVYFGDDAGVFHALDAETGKEAWKFDTRTEDGGGQEIISSANFSLERVLFGSYDSYLYCLIASDGKLVWKVQTQGPVHSTPSVADGKTFIAGCDEHLRTIDIESGKEVAALEMGGYSTAAPAVSGEKLVVGTFNTQVLCVDWKASKVLWRYEHPEKKFPFYSSAAIGVLKGRALAAVLGGRDKMVHAVRVDDGKPLWTFPTRGRVDASPVIAGSRVIAAGLDGTMYLLDLETGKEVWKFEAGAPLSASPAVGEGRLVVSSEDGVVYCFDVTPSP